MQTSLADFTVELIQDLKDLRAGKISAKDARVRALLAREVLRSVHLHMEGLRYLDGQATDARQSISGKS